MSVLANLLAGLFYGLVGFFAKWVSKKAAVAGAAVTVFTSLTVALYAALSAGLTGLAQTLPSYPGMELAVYVAAPAILPVAVSAVLAAEAAAALYRINVVILMTVAQS